jgi:hypothetical protein
MSVLINASTSTGLVQSADTSGEIELQSNGTTALKVNTNEGIQILNCLGVGNATPSTSGAGITFPATQSASTDANTLDDYEEGTWTPSIGGTATYLGQTGFYRKIGSLVFVSGYLNINVIGTGSTSTISGLPFNPNASAAINECVFAVAKAESLSASVTSISLRNNGTDILSTYRTSASASGTVNGAYIQNSTEINFSGCYLIY